MESAPPLVKTADLLRPFRRLGGALLDVLYPPQCLACGSPTASADALCVSCFGRLRPITAPYCLVLGLPFEVSLGPDVRSAEAIADPPPFDRARSAVIYNEVARSIVGQMKYGDRPELARFCARAMASAGHELWGLDAVLVPVPLHRARHLSRRYNQSTELARVLSALTNVQLAPGLIRRHRNTRQQVGLSGSARQRNVQGAFSPHPRLLEHLRGRRIVLVDDVITTGATVKAISRMLRTAGVGGIDVVSFARVVTGETEPV